ncbi:hypothetical protein CMEL01_11757 [Colletotrichum melonis]|uniref:Uncharacterized protein n=1 Tax=Colletotrichum melonis TaxID=1209925 RepID=A0AAI9UVX0_9PEZI|nr:hypothetical protein CMEL01_11757 [Colletotrichum melonis]
MPASFLLRVGLIRDMGPGVWPAWTFTPYGWHTRLFYRLGSLGGVAMLPDDGDEGVEANMLIPDSIDLVGAGEPLRNGESRGTKPA